MLNLVVKRFLSGDAEDLIGVEQYGPVFVNSMQAMHVTVECAALRRGWSLHV